MTYGLRFAHAGKDYYLEGTRAIRDARGNGLWKGTTRLQCQLHEGTDARGRIVGAGVLTMGVGQLLQLISSMHPARRGSAGLSAMARFGRFFLGPLWDVYEPRARRGPAREPVMETGAPAAPPPG